MYMSRKLIVLSSLLVFWKYVNNTKINHCVKSVRIQSISGPYFSALGLNTDQKIFEYGHFLHSEYLLCNLAFDHLWMKDWF